MTTDTLATDAVSSDAGRYLRMSASCGLLGPLVGYGIDGWRLPSVLSALGILFSIAFVFLLLPLVLRETARSPADGL